jgi:hypothetical protein
MFLVQGEYIMSIYEIVFPLIDSLLYGWNFTKRWNFNLKWKKGDFGGFSIGKIQNSSDNGNNEAGIRKTTIESHNVLSYQDKFLLVGIFFQWNRIMFFATFVSPWVSISNMNKLVFIYFSHCKSLYYLTFGASKLFQEIQKKGIVLCVLFDLWYYKKGLIVWIFKRFFFFFWEIKFEVFEVTRFSDFLFILWCSLRLFIYCGGSKLSSAF